MLANLKSHLERTGRSTQIFLPSNVKFAEFDDDQLDDLFDIAHKNALDMIRLEEDKVVPFSTKTERKTRVDAWD